MKKWLTAFTVICALTLADGVLTLYNTPDLSREGNPLIKYLGLGWGALITVNVAFLVVLFFICRYTFFKYQTAVLDVPDMRSYISQLFFDRPDKFLWVFTKPFPKNWKPLLALIAYICYFGFCAATTVNVLEWLAATFASNPSKTFGKSLLNLTNYAILPSLLFRNVTIVKTNSSVHLVSSAISTKVAVII